MAARLPELLEAGLSMVGGCCGTTGQVTLKVAVSPNFVT
jgi:methionine synthase I (cobalamin-dependent)